MKKIISLILTLALTLSLFTPVFATQEKNTPSEQVLKSVALTGITLPAAGKKVPADPSESGKIKILVTQNGEQKELTAIPFSATWTEQDNPGANIAGTDFIPGKTYRLTVTLEFMDSAPKVNEGTTKFTVNKEEASYLSTKGQKILFCCDFLASAGDITPKVSVEVSGEKTKTYDGKETTLTAKVEKIDGVTYSYVWLQSGTTLSDETREEIKLKNVSQSGEYSCKVTATVGNTSSSATSEKVKIQISPLTVVIKIDDAEKEMFKDDPEFTYTVKGEIYDELVGEPEREEGEDVGSYEIGIGTLAFKAGVAENYEIEVETGTLTIEAGEDLPLVPLTKFADQSYITGKNDSEIKIYITKGALPEGAVLTLSLPETGANEKLEKEKKKTVLKSFSLSLVDDEGKAIQLPDHAKVCIYIPLTEKEEKSFDLSTITAALYAKKVQSLSASVEKDGKVSYIVIETTKVGTIALFEGKEIALGTGEEEKDTDKNGSALLWVLIVVATLLSVGAIFFTVWQIRKTDGKPVKKEEKKAQVTEAEQKEKERKRKIAKELNSLPPVPEMAVKREKIDDSRMIDTKAMETRGFDAQAMDTMDAKTIKVAPIASDTIKVAPVASDTIKVAPVASDTIKVAPVAGDTIKVAPVVSEDTRPAPFIPEIKDEQTVEASVETGGQISFEDLED